jgi:hypothetical protein
MRHGSRAHLVGGQGSFLEPGIVFDDAKIVDELDPDALVGHRLLSRILPTIFARGAARCSSAFDYARIGRFVLRPPVNWKRAAPAGSTWSSRDALRSVAGRIACDAYVVAREHLKMASYEVGAMARMFRGEDGRLYDYAPDEVRDTLRLGGRRGMEILVQRLHDGARTAVDVVRDVDALQLACHLAAASGYTVNGCLNEGRSKRAEVRFFVART